MARFETSGLEDVIAEMKRLGELAGETADEMLMAGAEETKIAWNASAKKQGYDTPGKSDRATGDMLKSIGYANSPKTVQDVRVIDIYPQGKDRKGVRNAEKAFVLHYGRNNMPGTHWVDDADRAAEEPVTKVMTDIWEKHLKGK